MHLTPEDRDALHALQRALDASTDTIDDVLKLAGAGFGARPFDELARLFDGPLTTWQCEELSDHLGTLLDTVDALLHEGARAHLDPSIPARLAPLCAHLRDLEDRLADAADA